MERWVNKVAVVTGADSGIGRAITEQLVQNGMKVVGISLKMDKMKVLADEWKNKAGKLIPLQCDLANEIEIIRSMDWIEKNLGAVELLVNNAAVDLPTSVIEGALDEWEKTLDVNVLAPVVLTKEMLRILKKTGMNTGAIININDAIAWNGIGCGIGGGVGVEAGGGVGRGGNQTINTGLVASKLALRGLTDNLRIELAQIQSNVKVISIVPGPVDTEMTEQSLRENSRLTLKPKDVADTILLAIQNPESVLIQEIIITPLRSIKM